MEPYISTCFLEMFWAEFVALDRPGPTWTGPAQVGQSCSVVFSALPDDSILRAVTNELLPALQSQGGGRKMPGKMPVLGDMLDDPPAVPSQIHDRFLLHRCHPRVLLHGLSQHLPRTGWGDNGRIFWWNTPWKEEKLREPGPNIQWFGHFIFVLMFKCNLFGIISVIASMIELNISKDECCFLNHHSKCVWIMYRNRWCQSEIEGIILGLPVQ